VKAVMLSGPLTDNDLAELLTAVRRIERRNPGALYQAMIVDLAREPSLEEMGERLERVFPRVSGAEPFFATIGRQRP
jgi:hypothetical protein